MRSLVKPRDGKWKGGYQRLGGGEPGELAFDGHSVSVWEAEKVLEVKGGDGCTTV